MRWAYQVLCICDMIRWSLTKSHTISIEFNFQYIFYIHLKLLYKFAKLNCSNILKYLSYRKGKHSLISLYYCIICIIPTQDHYIDKQYLCKIVSFPNTHRCFDIDQLSPTKLTIETTSATLVRKQRVYC